MMLFPYDQFNFREELVGIKNRNLNKKDDHSAST